MKYFKSQLVVMVLVLVSCKGAEQETEMPEEMHGEQSMNKIYGNWNLDSSSYLTNNIKNIVTPPMMPTVWSFEKDGKYVVKNSVELPGTFSVTSDSLFVVLMGVPNNYGIMKLNETNLVLRATITETDSTLLQTEAYLTRKN